MSRHFIANFPLTIIIILSRAISFFFVCAFQILMQTEAARIYKFLIWHDYHLATTHKIRLDFYHRGQALISRMRSFWNEFFNVCVCVIDKSDFHAHIARAARVEPSRLKQNQLSHITLFVSARTLKKIMRVVLVRTTVNLMHTMGTTKQNEPRTGQCKINITMWTVCCKQVAARCSHI